MTWLYNLVARMPRAIPWVSCELKYQNVHFFCPGFQFDRYGLRSDRYDPGQRWLLRVLRYHGGERILAWPSARYS